MSELERGTGGFSGDYGNDTWSAERERQRELEREQDREALDSDALQQPEALEREIDETRARMSEGISELGERLDPERLKETAKSAVTDSVRDAADAAGEKARRAGSRAAGFLGDNAAPLAMIGVGVTWLLADRSRRRSSRERTRRFSAYQGTERRISRYPAGSGMGSGTGGWQSWSGPERRGAWSEGGQRGQQGGGGIAEKASEMTDTAREKASELTDTARQKASELTETARNRFEEMSDRMSERMSEQGRRLRTRYDRTMDENPVALVAGAAVLGLLAGMLVPTTNVERRVAGPTRDRLMSEAQDAAQKVKEVARSAASETKGTLKSEVQSVVDHAKDAATRVTKEAKANARDEAQARGLT